MGANEAKAVQRTAADLPKARAEFRKVQSMGLDPTEAIRLNQTAPLAAGIQAIIPIRATDLTKAINPSHFVYQAPKRTNGNAVPQLEEAAISEPEKTVTNKQIETAVIIKEKT